MSKATQPTPSGPWVPFKVHTWKPQKGDIIWGTVISRPQHHGGRFVYRVSGVRLLPILEGLQDGQEVQIVHTWMDGNTRVYKVYVRPPCSG